jgi:DNA-binding GntR family transcriptional regulator
MRRIDASRTMEEKVLGEIRQAILFGQLQPGARLRLRELSEELGVSSLPVRAALMRLRSEGLVRHTPRIGSVVAPLEYEELEEIQALRLGVEGLVARLGAERITTAEIERMRKKLPEVQELAEKQNLERYLRAEASFREVCFRASGRDRLVAHVIDLRLRAERYLRVAFSSPQGLSRSAGFQLELIAACEAHDGDAAEDVARRGLLWIKEAMAAHFDAGGGKLA